MIHGCIHATSPAKAIACFRVRLAGLRLSASSLPASPLSSGGLRACGELELADAVADGQRHSRTLRTVHHVARNLNAQVVGRSDQDGLGHCASHRVPPLYTSRGGAYSCLSGT